MNVSAIIVTRGDVDLHPCWETLPEEWEKIVWSNAMGWARVEPLAGKWWGELHPVPDLSVYGRYAAIEHATHDLIYVQDDDVIVSDPQAIVDEWDASRGWDTPGDPDIRWPDPPEACDYLVANMPQEFRHDGYVDSCLVGFGACFHRDLPTRVFERFLGGLPPGGTWFDRYRRDEWGDARIDEASFRRTCDVVFTTLTPFVLVDVPKVDREFASDDDRMWRQPDHYGERVRTLELARKVRDA